MKKTRIFPYRKVNFRSEFERGIARNLSKRKIRWRYEKHTPIPYWLSVYRAVCGGCGSKEIFSSHSYLPDFELIDYGIIVEAKGKFTPRDRNKMLAVIHDNPHLDIRMVFMRDNWLTRRHATKYSDWCEDHDIKWAVGTVPDTWLK